MLGEDRGLLALKGSIWFTRIGYVTMNPCLNTTCVPLIGITEKQFLVNSVHMEIGRKDESLKLLKV